ncbi:o-succinylbenzoate synthase [Streptosporangium algeriense]|uniref:o-succinylbenzoate synthase n=1 Tax=Streptosporangium algeriense TaxID=1682748 RepID=A0ABW3DZT4_9ACTN
MKITGIELRRITMPLIAPFRTSFGTEHHRDTLLVRVATPDTEGWGECAAMTAPLYSPEYTETAIDVLRRYLVPALVPHLTRPGPFDIHAVHRALRRYRGHQMAKSALETAVLDAGLRTAGQSLGSYLGAAVPAVPCGVSVGIMNSVEALLDAVDDYVAQGYRRIKLKIEPGWDLAPIRAVRERFGPDLLLQADANAAYTLVDAPHLAKLDPFGLLLIEQPLADDDLVQHARLAKLLRTPVCLDESIHSAEHAAAAITLGSCSIINIKPGRVGGYLEARRIHDLASAHGVAVWCGGMLETGIGRAANLALAALPGFTLPGDTSASSRYYTTDITAPFVLQDGHLPVPTGPGIGVDPIPDLLDEVTVSTEWIPF